MEGVLLIAKLGIITLLMDPIQKDCHISMQRFDSWINQALAGYFDIEIIHKPDKAIIFKGSYFLNDVKQDLPKYKVKEIFWGLMHRYKRIQVNGDLYLLSNQEEELWDKYHA